MKWMQFILFLSGVSFGSAQVNDLTIYVYPPTMKLDWKSPKSLIHSFLKIEASKKARQIVTPATDYVSDFEEAGSIDTHYMSTMGHTIAHIQCVLPTGSQYSRWTSLSGQDNASEDFDLVFKKKIGVGLLFHKYSDGHIISGQENYKRLVHYKGQKYKDASGKMVTAKPKYISFSIGAEQCQSLKDMVDFYESFHFPKTTPFEELKKRKSTETLYFTNVIDPYDSYILRKTDPTADVGGGCAPYAVGLIRAIGEFAPAFEKKWSRVQPVSEILIGGKTDVNIRDILFGKLGQHWVYAGKANEVVKMYDPQNIWDDIRAIEACLTHSQCELSELKSEFPGKTISAGKPRVLSDTFKSGKNTKSASQEISGILIQ